ncbi:MAG: sulfatase [Planctomycetes bacterium]|nr:sulfatase [Planctomycetota bacterium]
MRHRRIWRSATVAVSVLAGLVTAGCSKTPGERPKADYNVLLVTLDTTRADYLSCYGHTPETSPNLDALAREGIRFAKAISQSAATPVSHASILTGLNPYQHGVRVIYAEEGYRLPDNVPTLATLLKGHGWQTAAYLSSFTVSEFYGFDRGFDTFDSGLKVPAHESFQKGDGVWLWPVKENQRRSDATTDQAIAGLKQAQGPFCAWVHYWDPHDPQVLPPDDVMARFVSDGMDMPTRRRAIYAAEVFYMDSQFGRLIQYLKEAGEYEKTIIVVVADHGEGLGDHDWWFHRILYQEQIHVPLIMRVPGWPSGKVVSDLVRTVDIVPTILEALGAAPPAGVAGRSVRPLVEGQADTVRIAYADAINAFDLNSKLAEQRPLDEMLHCATDGTWKLILRPRLEDQSELYNIKDDPRETKNLYAQESGHADRLKVELAKCNGFVNKPFGAAVDPDVQARLRSLGYLGGDSSSTPPPAPTTRPATTSRP